MVTAAPEEKMSDVSVEVAVNGHAGGKDMNGSLQNGGSSEKKDDEMDVKDLANGNGVGGILGSPPEEMLKAAQGGWDAPLPKQAERRVNRGPRPDFTKERNAVNEAEAALKGKRDKQELITAALRLKQVARQDAYDNLKSARSRLRDINAEVTSKHTELRPLQEALKKLQEKGRAARDKSRGLPANSEDELDRRIAQLEFRMHHESIPLSEEKSIMREIKALQSSRTEVRALASMHMEHADGQGQREALQARLQPLQIEEKALLLERDAARKIVGDFEKEALALEEAVKELLAERSQAMNEHQKAYEAIKAARADFAESRRLAAAGEYTGPTLPRRSLAEDVADLEKAVGRPPRLEQQQNGVVEFEPGSTTGFDEAVAPVAKPYKPSPAPKPKVVAPAVSAPAPPKVVLPVAAAPPAPPAAESKPASPVATAPAAAVEAPSKEVEAVPEAPVEPKKTPEELAAEEAAAKERRRQEEIEKAREAEDRKKKAAERAEAKARARAAREAEEAAEKKKRAEEKKARKKAAAAPGTGGSLADAAEDSSPEAGEAGEKAAPASELAKAAPAAEEGDGMRRRKKGGAGKVKASTTLPSTKLLKRRGDSWMRSQNIGYYIAALVFVVFVGVLIYQAAAAPRPVYASSGEAEK